MIIRIICEFIIIYMLDTCHQSFFLSHPVDDGLDVIHI